MKAWLLGALWAGPLLAGLAASRMRRAAAARALGVAASALVLAVAIVLFVSTEASSLTGLPGVRALAVAGLGVDGLSAVLLPVVALLSLAVLIAAPRADLDAPAVTKVLIAEGAALGAFVSANVLLFACFWTLSLVPLWLEAHHRGDAALRRATRWAALTSVVPLVVAVALAVWIGARAGLPSPFDVGELAHARALRPWAPALGGLVLVSTAARMGVFPFHAWVPVALERGRVAAVLPAVISSLGSFALARLGLALFPSAVEQATPFIVPIGTLSAVYGALLALGQQDARRQLGYLWVSIAGFVFVGLGSLNAGGTSGALLHDVATSVSVSGLFLVVRAVEARAGTADMRRLGSLVQRAPRLATGYFILGAATIGFPGTATFVSEDLLVQGLLHDHLLSAVLLLAASAVNGVTLVRSFKRIFLGPPAPHAASHRRVEDMLPRERRVAVALVLVLLAGGFVPAPVLAIREGVIESLRGVDQSPAHP